MMTISKKYKAFVLALFTLMGAAGAFAHEANPNHRCIAGNFIRAFGNAAKVVGPPKVTHNRNGVSATQNVSLGEDRFARFSAEYAETGHSAIILSSEYFGKIENSDPAAAVERYDRDRHLVSVDEFGILSQQARETAKANLARFRVSALASPKECGVQ